MVANSIVTELSNRDLDELVNYILKGLKNDKRLLTAAVRLSSIPLVISSYPNLIPLILNQIKDPDNIDPDIKDSVLVMLEEASET